MKTTPYIPMFRLYKDGGAGVTEVSLKYWKQIRKKVGKVVVVCCFKGGSYPPVYNTIVWDDRGNMVLLSGFACGYGGAGPHGLFKFLQDEGFDTTIKEVASTDFFWKQCRDRL